MAQMMEVIIRMAREKGTVDDDGSANTTSTVKGITESLAYPPFSLAMPEVGISHYPIPLMANAMLETYPSFCASMPSEEFTLSPSTVQAEVNSATLFA